MNMKFKCCSFQEMSRDISVNKKKIIMFGAGVIGQITAPEILKKYELLQYLECYLDNNSVKWGDYIDVYGKSYEIKSPQYLTECTNDIVVFINISRFADVVEQLKQMTCTEKMTAYIMPMMCIHNWCSEKSVGTPKLSEVPLIPKVIHYMWLGGKSLPDSLKYCIDLWKKVCPDYEIIEWNESNYDISKHPYMQQAYAKQAYGFVPDYARIDILYNYGGFYMDTDIELKKSLDELRYQEAFVGLEKWQVVNFGGCSGAVKGHPMVKKFLDARKNVYFLDQSGVQNKNTCGFYDTKVILDNGYKMDGTTQCLNGMNIYAYDFFHPYDYMSGINNETENTRSVHHFNGGWLDENMRMQNEITKHKYLKLYGNCTCKNND